MKRHPSMTAVGMAGLIAGVLLVLAAIAAKADEVSGAIVFAVDASLSVDRETADMQRQGHIGALTSPDVLSAIQATYSGCISVSYFEWASRESARIILPWTKICNRDDAFRSASIIHAKGDRGKIRYGKAMTSISSAIDFAVSLLDQVPGQNFLKVIDISSNGTNNDGGSVAHSRIRAMERGYTINAIVIPSIEEGDIEEYFADQVIGGPMSFVTVPRSSQDYAEALRQKIVVEVSELERIANHSSAN